MSGYPIPLSLAHLVSYAQKRKRRGTSRAGFRSLTVSGRCAACSALANDRRLIERLRLQQPAHPEHQVVRLDIVERHCRERIPRHERWIEVLQDPRARIADVEIAIGELDREVR